MIENIFVVDVSAHSYNLGEDNYAAGHPSVREDRGDCISGAIHFIGAH